MSVVSATGTTLGKVSDVRVRAPSGTTGYGGLTVDGLVVAQHDTGSLLGYDRRSQQGPSLVRAIVAYLYRNAGYTPWSDVRTVDWDKRQVLLSADSLEDLAEP